MWTIFCMHNFLVYQTSILASTFPAYCYFLITFWTEKLGTWKHFAIFDPSPALWASIIFIFRVLGSYLEEPMAADCWDRVTGSMGIYKKIWLLHHPTFPNDDCKQALTLTGWFRSDTLVKAIWELKWPALSILRVRVRVIFCLKYWNRAIKLRLLEIILLFINRNPQSFACHCIWNQ